jgi:hypothetical protein
VVLIVAAEGLKRPEHLSSDVGQCRLKFMGRQRNKLTKSLSYLRAQRRGHALCIVHNAQELAAAAQQQ